MEHLFSHRLVMTHEKHLKETRMQRGNAQLAKQFLSICATTVASSFQSTYCFPSAFERNPEPPLMPF